ANFTVPLTLPAWLLSTGAAALEPPAGPVLDVSSDFLLQAVKTNKASASASAGVTLQASLFVIAAPFLFALVFWIALLAPAQCAPAPSGKPIILNQLSDLAAK